MMTSNTSSITSEEIAKTLCRLAIESAVKEPLESDGNLLLNEKERALLLIAHLFDLFEKYNFKNLNQSDLLDIFVVNCCNIKNEENYMFGLATTIDSIKKIRSFFKDIPTENVNEVAKHIMHSKFLFDKDLNSSQRILVFAWCMNQFKAFDDTLKSMMEKFTIVDKK